MTIKQTVILGLFLLAAALAHAGLSRALPAPAPRPLYTGTVAGEILRREQAGIAHLKCNGFRVECYDSFVVVHVEKAKEPTWTDDYVLTIPWSQVEYLTLAPER